MIKRQDEFKWSHLLSMSVQSQAIAILDLRPKTLQTFKVMLMVRLKKVSPVTLHEIDQCQVFVKLLIYLFE